MAVHMRITDADLLRVFASPDHAALSAIFRPRSYLRRQIMFTPETEENLVFVVASGRVRIFLASEDKELTLTILKPGDIYTTHTKAFIQAYKDSTILAAPAAEFRRQIEAHPELTFATVRVLGDLLRKSFNIIHTLAFKDVRRRLREFLRREARLHGEAGEGGLTLDLELTVEELAGLLGSTRQTVSTALNELIREGALTRLDRRTYRIPDPARLKD